jgi:dipeptidyl aminopeptidase/acylaminoacyl peptidase
MKLLCGFSYKKDRLWQQVMLICALIPLVLLTACDSNTRGTQTTPITPTPNPTSTVATSPVATTAAGPLTNQTQVNINFHHRVNEVHWSPDGQYVATLVSVVPDTQSPSYSDTLEVVNAQSGKIIGEESFAKMHADISRLRWSPNSTLLAFQVDTYSGTNLTTAIEVWSLQSQNKLWQQQLAPMRARMRCSGHLTLNFWRSILARRHP